MSLASAYLRSAANVPLLLSDGGQLSRAHAATEASLIAERLCSRQMRCLVIHTSDAGHLVVALAAAEAARLPVVLAHSTLPKDEVHALCRRLGVPEYLDGSRSWIPTHGNVEPTTIPSGFTVTLMTSGTTGRPKLVRHTLESLLGRIPSLAGAGTGGGHRWLLTYQPTAFAGLQVILTALCTGGTVVQSANPSPGALFATAERCDVTHISGTPTFWRSLLLVAPVGSLSQLRQITVGGEAIDQPTLDRLAQRFPNRRLTHIYASSEVGALFSVHDGRAGFPSECLQGQAGGVGLRIRDGVLEVKSPRQMLGYLGDMPSKLTPDGWLITGDLVRIEGDRVFFLGRADDVLNIGGGKVYPQEVEEFFLSCPAVAEVRVRGVANPISGTILAADVVLEKGYEPAAQRRELLRLCQAKLPAFKAPRLIRVVDVIPTLSSGKKA
jgi:acyl-coenzyme A synthetase/AMP-(fatty) acid ligase